MKILHIADTHLGYSAYRKTTPEGINQREQDTYNVFSQFIDYALETKPDLILHSGDLFDAVRPTNRAITFALQQILRLSKQGVPFVVIDGNHEHPKLRETGHIFSIFDHLEHVYPVYNETYQQIPFQFNNETLTIHALPQCVTKETFEAETKKITLDSKADYNVLLAHAGIKEIPQFRMNEFNELLLPKASLKPNFDYIALGHFHTYTQVGDNAWYPGSPERFTFADAHDAKGFIETELDKKRSHRFIEIKTRPMTDAAPILCAGLSLQEIMNTITHTIQEIKPEEKILRIRLENISSQLYRSLDFRTIKDLCRTSVHFEIKPNIISHEEIQHQGTSRIGALVSEFEKFLDSENVTEKEILRKLGIHYLEKITTKDEDL